MKFAIIFAALFALAVAGPVSQSVVELVRSDVDVGPESHSYVVETSDGSKSESHGHLEKAGTEDASYRHEGSFSFIGDDGVTYAINYIADEHGYQPQGAHIPVAPEALH